MGFLVSLTLKFRTILGKKRISSKQIIWYNFVVFSFDYYSALSQIFFREKRSIYLRQFFLIAGNPVSIVLEENYLANMWLSPPGQWWPPASQPSAEAPPSSDYRNQTLIFSLLIKKYLKPILLRTLIDSCIKNTRLTFLSN